MKLNFFIAALLGLFAQSAYGADVEEVLHNNPELMEKYSHSGALFDGLDAFHAGGEGLTDAEKAMFEAMAESDDNTDDDGHGRRLGGYPSIVNEAWSRIKSGYPSSKTLSVGSPFGGQDRLKVERVGNTCWIVAEESNDAGDWWKNLDLGHEVIHGAGYSYSERYCKKSSWGRCRKYGYRTKTVDERGYDGFVKPFNSVRVALEKKVKSECSGLSSFVYAGYSRGAAIVQVAALSHMRQGITRSSNKVQLVTFGSPRALEDGGALEGFLDASHRVVKHSSSWFGDSYDPVATIPAGWWGFEHVGKTRYPGSMGSNSPTFGANYDVGLHMKYP